MMREVRKVRQVEGEPRRRWFTDEFFDLIVWFSPSGEIVGFQLSYDKFRQERALTWRPGEGFGHDGVDDGEDRPGKLKATPILVADGAFDATGIAERFSRESGDLPVEVVAFILAKLRDYPRG